MCDNALADESVGIGSVGYIKKQCGLCAARTTLLKPRMCGLISHG